MTTPGPTTLAGRIRSALLVMALVAGVLMVLELVLGHLLLAVVAALTAFVCVIAGARPTGGT